MQFRCPCTFLEAVSGLECDSSMGISSVNLGIGAVAVIFGYIGLPLFRDRSTGLEFWCRR